ncbi:glycosyltransferase, partial [Proteus mirabilis]|uniref:glycosyltransferase n=1 Tax=Proteus mirabilis TaxID=584 RepID=UPI0013D058AB
AQREWTADHREGHRLKPGFRVVFAGNLGVAQGLDTVLDAAEATRHVPDIKWIMIGEGRMRAELEAHAVTRGLSETVEIAGPFPSDRMPGLFAQADVLLMTLRRDPLFEL